MSNICHRCGGEGTLVSIANQGIDGDYFKCPACGHVWVHECDAPERVVADVMQHPSARTHCPDCFAPDVVDLTGLLSSERVDYFRCRSCRRLWMVPKGADEPAIRAVFGSPQASANSKKAG
jgi:hypothetical protein